MDVRTTLCIWVNNCARRHGSWYTLCVHTSTLVVRGQAHWDMGLAIISLIVALDSVTLSLVNPCFSFLGMVGHAVLLSGTVYLGGSMAQNAGIGTRIFLVSWVK